MDIVAPWGRPQKTVFGQKFQDELKQKAIQKIKEKFLPDEKIIKIVLIGSIAKGTFGKYEPPGFRGSLYSDFDFIIFTKDDYQIPSLLEREWNGRPFTDDALNLAYRSRKFVDDTYDAEIFFIRRKNMDNKDVQKQAEEAGIAMSSKSNHPHIEVFAKDKA